MWQVHQEGPILDGWLVVGSMVQLVTPTQRWRVEILWSGPDGNIVHETDNHAAAFAFILGVEQTMIRFTRGGFKPPDGADDSAAPLSPL